MPALVDVAAVYLSAPRHKPTVTVAQTFEVEHETARAWIKKARSEGLIPPAMKGSGPKVVPLNVSVPPLLRERVEELARATDMSMSELVTLALTEYTECG